MPGPSAKPTACAVVRKPIQRPCFESGIVSPTIDIAAGIKPESNMPSTKRMGMNSSGIFTNARRRLVTIKPAREMKRMGLRPMRPARDPPLGGDHQGPEDRPLLQYLPRSRHVRQTQDQGLYPGEVAEAARPGGFFVRKRAPIVLTADGRLKPTATPNQASHPWLP